MQIFDSLPLRLSQLIARRQGLRVPSQLAHRPHGRSALCIFSLASYAADCYPGYLQREHAHGARRARERAWTSCGEQTLHHRLRSIQAICSRAWRPASDHTPEYSDCTAQRSTPLRPLLVGHILHRAHDGTFCEGKVLSSSAINRHLTIAVP